MLEGGVEEIRGDGGVTPSRDGMGKVGSESRPERSRETVSGTPTPTEQTKGGGDMRGNGEVGGGRWGREGREVGTWGDGDMRGGRWGREGREVGT